MQREAVTQALGPLCDQLVVTPLADSGHYPMQEMPPLTVSLVERFLGNRAPRRSASTGNTATSEPFQREYFESGRRRRGGS